MADDKIEGVSFLDQILKIHTPYYKPLKDLFPSGLISGMAHITGGGIPGNLNRIIPSGLTAKVDLARIRVLPIFKYLQAKANLDDAEMLKTFNLGVGMVIVTPPESSQSIMNHLKPFQVDVYPIGSIAEGDEKIAVNGKLSLTA
jgi:phosphoribosylformylglycinamidine cyclo-ligase